MPLQRLQIEDLRCIERAELRLHPERNYVYGPNGAGKTTLLESVYLLGRGRSFRTRQTSRLIRRGSAGFSVFGEVEAPARRRRVGVGFSSGALSIRIDGEDATGVVALADVLAVFVIDPKLHQVIEAGPSERRRFLDWGVFHVEHHYLDAWRQYRRILSQRNAALKRSGPAADLKVWTEELAQVGEGIDAARRRYVADLRTHVRRIGAQVLQQDLDLGYRPGWRQGLSFAEALDRSSAHEHATGVTQVGPHRADLDLRLAGMPVRDEASRGQQKLVVATLVLGQLSVWEEQRQEGGVLLVDDPAAELDRGALERLMAQVRSVQAQLLVTGLSERHLVPEGGYPVFHVEQGRVQAVV